ncbi:MAG: NUDIX domain-containing protein [candidate division WOR-3 bacterium]|nr:NUDIX domain-containing protein [candidate division WOR-3 bacterium]
MTFPTRHVARVIIIDGADSVLLCRYSETIDDLAVCYWVPPGGALEAGEDHHAAALRETREETGLVVQLGRQLCERRFILHMQDGPVDQIERYFLARLSSVKPEVANSLGEDIQELRWWPFHDLRFTTERIYPEGLVEQLSSLMAGTRISK